MNLLELYKVILDDKKAWRERDFGTINSDVTTLFDKKESKNFITSYFFSTLKLKVLPWKDYRNDEFERAPHTVSLFLLGIAFFKRLDLKISTMPQYYKNDYQNFLHIWAGMCLYHDIGYLYEQRDNDLARNWGNLTDFMREYPIKNSLFDITDNNEKTLAENYYKYRIAERKKVDHGIVGGLILYDRMIANINKHKKIYEEYEAARKKGEKCYYLGDTSLFFKGYIQDQYIQSVKIMAYNILKHNMWFANEYSNDLAELIPKSDGSHKYSFSKQPFLFLLGMLDTLEPIKRYNKICPYEVLKRIDIVFDKPTHSSTITVDSSLKPKKYFENIYGLMNWLNISVDYSASSVTISAV